MRDPRMESTLKELYSAIERAREALQRAESRDSFKIVVCGAFSTGKTSLLNALLRCNLPTGVRPITKVITNIRYGPRERICLENVKTGQIKVLSNQEATEWILNKNKNSGYEDLRICYERPSGFLKSGVEFIDTPGFQDDAEEKLDDMTQKAIRESDFCIVTFACNSLGDMHEREFLEELQQMTNGNYVCILNCANRIKSLEEQEELLERARFILRDCGNERIGYGRYFLVDSDRDSEEKYLDGLDAWLMKLVRNHAAAIRREAAVFRGKAELLPLIEKGDRIFQANLQEYETYMLDREKKLISQCHSMATSGGYLVQKLGNVRRNFFKQLDNAFLSCVYSDLRSIPNWDFNNKASKVIADTILKYSNNLEDTMKRTFPESVLPDPWGEISQTTLIWTKRHTWTTRKSFTEYMADGLNYGDWEWDVSHENDFVRETMTDTETKTIPEIKKYANQYFSGIEKKLVSKQCVKLLTDSTIIQEDHVAALDMLAGVLMDAKALQFRLETLQAGNGG